MPKLTTQRRAFVDEYLIDLNGTQAAIRAGYSKKTANAQAGRLLANVSIQAAIQSRQKDRQQRTEITQDRVLMELAAIGFASGADYATVDHSGMVVIAPTQTLTHAQKAAVTGIKATQCGVEIKLADKVKALELMGKHLGMFSGGGQKDETATTSNLFDRIAEITGEGDDYGIPEVEQPPEDDNDLVE